MKMVKRIVTMGACLAVAVGCSVRTAADGTLPPIQSVQSDIVSDNTIMNDVSAKSAILVEINTKTVIAAKYEHEKRPVSHLAKLMTVLIAAEEIADGKLSLTDKAVASANANSQKAPQIWLDVGESITIDELLKAIIVGNANDACTVLGEKIGGSSEKFVDLLNKRAEQLGMGDTHFADICGTDENTVSTAYDLSILAGELLKYNDLTEYFSTWMCNVRKNAVELVSTNRLIRTYKGAYGMKACASKSSGECLVACAKRGNMAVCCVLLDCSSSDAKFSEAKSVMDYGFTAYEIYEPEISDEITEKIKIINGEKLDADVKVNDLSEILIPRGAYSQIKCDFQREESLEAPVKKGDIIGTVVFRNSEKEILKSDIVLDETVEKIGVLFALKRILCNLLYI